MGNWFKKEDGEFAHLPEWTNQELPQREREDSSSFAERRQQRRAIPSLPRPITFRRQNSERREKLSPTKTSFAERRAYSVDRRGTLSSRRSSSPSPAPLPSRSFPDVSDTDNGTSLDGLREARRSDASENARGAGDGLQQTGQPGQPPPLEPADAFVEQETSSVGLDSEALQQELEAKWILNLSMHFRDQSEREKFFVTYAEEPNKWRRVTVSCDYRHAQSGSLEAELKTLHYQRDKILRIYDSIRESLPDIQFFDTVTNLKLETEDSQLHVHVTEDVNEIIPYPPLSSFNHVDCPRFLESQVRFESHISGFVYKVKVGGRTYIKKEIPSPENVDEFNYEVNALHDLEGSKSVISFSGLIVDDRSSVVKGLLIPYAEQGALVDLLFDRKDTPSMSWGRRERWAKQIVQGLSEIHGGGFVQGDFTLSNIVVDANDDAKIIDINRRGCPVGWEPPELTTRIDAGQRISIYIGVKTDLFQLGMVLWALAEVQDEPEREERPLEFTSASDDVPPYFKDIVRICLSSKPRERASAEHLLTLFPEVSREHARPLDEFRHSVSTHRSDKEYIDPAVAVGREDIDEYRTRNAATTHSVPSTGFTFADAVPSTEYQFDSSNSYLVGRRGRSPLAVAGGGPERQWERVYIDDSPSLVHRGSLRPISSDLDLREEGVPCLPTDDARTPQTNSNLAIDSLALAGISAIDCHGPPELPGATMDVPKKQSFQERVHMLRRSNDSALADLEFEAAQERTPEAKGVVEGFRFGPPMHQDSGFNEPKGSMADMNAANEESRSRVDLATTPLTAIPIYSAEIVTSESPKDGSGEHTMDIPVAAPAGTQPDHPNTAPLSHLPACGPQDLLEQCGIPISHRQILDQDAFVPSSPKNS
ncbi:hypothetical protein H2199_008258 [Coniosporium tulheliwenetii]|uniref:Uncharacterized protein n=1 Tax=Coniosporium tulheliwenetii TaxID=3383036 RepID=A0ACC2YKT0_9PEZI|nr:hypothetical protein H2199_008258 [Cladosporium sp. JES 115]